MARSLPPRRPIPNAPRVLAISSAKGGVGKSTLAAHLARTFARRGHRTGILDADLYGPSVPSLFGLAGAGEPALTPDGRLVPLPSAGVQTMSMGYLAREGAAVAWRGPMLQKALQQLLHAVAWGPLDVLVLDLPPGTGDVQLTVAQQVEVAGAVVVTTPQRLALEDAARGVEMLRKSEVRVLGVVGNMSRFVCPGCGGVHRLFGNEEGMGRMCVEKGLEMLGDVPLDVRMGEDGAMGVLGEGKGAAAEEIGRIADRIEKMIGL